MDLSLLAAGLGFLLIVGLIVGLALRRLNGGGR